MAVERPGAQPRLLEHLRHGELSPATVDRWAASMSATTSS